MIKKLLLSAAVLAAAFSTEAALPQVQLRDMHGNSVDTSTLSNDGKPFVIDFWATWCKPCVRELKAIADVYDEWVEETGVEICKHTINDYWIKIKALCKLSQKQIVKCPGSSTAWAGEPAYPAHITGCQFPIPLISAMCEPITDKTKRQPKSLSYLVKDFVRPVSTI